MVHPPSAVRGPRETLSERSFPERPNCAPIFAFSDKAITPDEHEIEMISPDSVGLLTANREEESEWTEVAKRGRNRNKRRNGNKNGTQHEKVYRQISSSCNS